MDPAQFDDDQFLNADDLEDSDEEVELQALPLATTVDQPIPALRQAMARSVHVDTKGQVQDEPTADSQSFVVLEDPEGFAVKPAVLSTGAYLLASFFDGKRSAKDAVAAFAEKYKQSPDPHQVLQLQRELDKGLFLQSTNFENTIRAQIKGYLEQDIRAAANSGVTYPEDAKGAMEMIDAFFIARDGPGALKLPAANAPAQPGNGNGKSVKAMIVPHIDLNVGGSAYAHGYREIVEHCDAEIFVILGVAHQNPGAHLFYVSQKDFATPFGVLRTDRAIARRLQGAADCEPTLAELAHRTEFSIEFQTLMLMGLLGERMKREIRIVPVLCGAIETCLADDINPLEHEPFQRFTAALRAELDASSKKWCILCSVDFSHVGPEFHNSTMISEKNLPAIERGDRKVLQLIERLDRPGIYKEISRTQNSRHLDGIIAIMTMLQSCQGILKSGRTLQYKTFLKPQTHGAVSYVSMAFE